MQSYDRFHLNTLSLNPQNFSFFCFVFLLTSSCNIFSWFPHLLIENKQMTHDRYTNDYLRRGSVPESRVDNCNIINMVLFHKEISSCEVTISAKFISLFPLSVRGTNCPYCNRKLKLSRFPHAFINKYRSYQLSNAIIYIITEIRLWVSMISHFFLHYKKKTRVWFSSLHYCILRNPGLSSKFKNLKKLNFRFSLNKHVNAFGGEGIHICLLEERPYFLGVREVGVY